MSALADHRKRLAERGRKRVERCARPDDARRLKAAARILARDDAEAKALRRAIDAVVPERSVDPFVAGALSIPLDPEFTEVMDRVVADRKRHRSRKVVL